MQKWFLYLLPFSYRYYWKPRTKNNAHITLNEFCWVFFWIFGFLFLKYIKLTRWIFIAHILQGYKSVHVFRYYNVGFTGHFLRSEKCYQSFVPSAIYGLHVDASNFLRYVSVWFINIYYTNYAKASYLFSFYKRNLFDCYLVKND